MRTEKQLTQIAYTTSTYNDFHQGQEAEKTSGRCTYNYNEEVTVGKTYNYNEEVTIGKIAFILSNCPKNN